MKSDTTLLAIAVVGVACLITSSGLCAQSAQGKPGGTPTPQDVNVVNTPTVNIGSGGPIGVDVLTMPPQVIAVSGPAPKSIVASVVVPAGYDQPEPFTYTPPSGKRVVIRSLMLTETAEVGCLTNTRIAYTGGYQIFFWQSTTQYPELNLALPPGPISVSFTKRWNTLGCSPAPVAFVANLLMTIDEVTAD